MSVVRRLSQPASPNCKEIQKAKSPFTSQKWVTRNPSYQIGRRKGGIRAQANPQEIKQITVRASKGVSSGVRQTVHCLAPAPDRNQMMKAAQRPPWSRLIWVK